MFGGLYVGDIGIAPPHIFMHIFREVLRLFSRIMYGHRVCILKLEHREPDYRRAGPPLARYDGKGLFGEQKGPGMKKPH